MAIQSGYPGVYEIHKIYEKKTQTRERKRERKYKKQKYVKIKNKGCK